MFGWNPSGATDKTSLVIEFESATASKPPAGKVSSFDVNTELMASQAAGDAKVLADLGRPVLTLTLGNPVEDFHTILRAIG
jgi:hypothetical protein